MSWSCPHRGHRFSFFIWCFCYSQFLPLTNYILKKRAKGGFPDIAFLNVRFDLGVQKSEQKCGVPISGKADSKKSKK